MLEIFKSKVPFALECGQVLPHIEVAYHTFGKLNPQRDNVVWVCHALTANTDVSDWWAGSFGQGQLIDPTKDFVVCANIIGSCYGSTHALSVNPETGQPFYHNFPIITIRDTVHAFDLLREHLGIEYIRDAIGGSLGGMHALEWAIYRPQLFQNLTLLATNAVNSPWAIALNESQRMAIQADQSWSSDHPDAGLIGLQTARSIALLSYRNHNAYSQTQAEEDTEKLDHYKASSYQRYQGQKLSQRFDAFSYWTLTKSLDTHHVGRGRPSVEQALQRIKTKTLIIGIASDLLFPTSEQEYLAKHIPNASYAEIVSLFGHDGFLIEHDAIHQAYQDFFIEN